MSKTIRIGTKGSKLGLWQAEYVANLIKPSGYITEIVSFDSTDVKSDPKKNLELNLLNGNIDVIIHHAKDVPADLHEELELVAFTERELPNDALISNQENLDPKSDSIKIGASSIRRIAFIKHFYPFSKPVFAPGDLPTQIQQMKQGEYDALLLAYADVHHLGYDSLIVEKIETSYFVPAVG